MHKTPLPLYEAFGITMDNIKLDGKKKRLSESTSVPPRTVPFRTKFALSSKLKLFYAFSPHFKHSNTLRIPNTVKSTNVRRLADRSTSPTLPATLIPLINQRSRRWGRRNYGRWRGSSSSSRWCGHPTKVGTNSTVSILRTTLTGRTCTTHTSSTGTSLAILWTCTAVVVFGTA